MPILALLSNLDMGAGTPPVIPANSFLHKDIPTSKWEKTWRDSFDWSIKRLTIGNPT